MFEEDHLADEHIGWPSYVDFLSTFVFVLIVFVGSLLYLLSGDIRQRVVEQRIQGVIRGLKGTGVVFERDGDRLVFPLKSKVEFATNQAEILPQHERYLREVGKSFGNPGVQRIVILGFADSQPCRIDPFCNWDLSARRAQAVLKYYYTCADCEYDPASIRKKLTMTGEGDITSTKPGSHDRRVDIILEFERSGN
ncbi:MAG TPA: OmpA family protein [Bryobacteraceae bacterium]|nr:OmpA family protein [Bryobacteraceae bacterium]